MARNFLVLLLVVAASSVSSAEPALPALRTIGSSGRFEDRGSHPDAGRLNLPFGRLAWEIDGNTVQGYGYAGHVPGPLLEVEQGSALELVLKNTSDEPTTLHPHGLRGDYRSDGVPGLGQDPVEPGASFVHHLIFPDPGLFWYHPHVRDWSGRGRGAFGMILVHPKLPTYFNRVGREECLALSDVTTGAMVSEPDPKALADRVLSGFWGETFLVNGTTNYSLKVKRGEVVRFFFLNAADARPFNVAIEGARLKVIGSELGKSEREEFADSVLLLPAERYIVEVLFDTPGEHHIVHRAPTGDRPLGNVIVADGPLDPGAQAAFGKLHDNKDVIADIDPFRGAAAKGPSKRLRIVLDRIGETFASRKIRRKAIRGVPASMPPGVPPWAAVQNLVWDEPMYLQNEQSTPANTIWKLVDDDTRLANSAIHWSFRKGERVRIRVEGGEMQHPLHFHGQRFLVLSADGKRNPNLQWKDTVVVRANEVVELLLDASNPGHWMFHCHIARHNIDQPDHRMVGYYDVVDPQHPLEPTAAAHHH